MGRNSTTNKPVRAAIYVRVSSERQAAEDRVSIEVQLQECIAYCEEHGYRIFAQYVDKEKYRTKGKLVQPSAQRKDRPAYQAMLKAARDDYFDIIIAWKEDRLYRGMYAAMPLAELLDEKGARLTIELVRETFDRKMLGIKAALGKIEVDNIRERMLMGRRAHLERGEVPGGDQVRYGYRKVERHLEIDEQEAAIVRQIFDWYVSGETSMAIRRRLHAMKTPPRFGDLWPKSSICRITYSEFYATGKIPTELEGETFVISCPPIISLETWQKASAIRQRNKSKARNLKRDFLCIGLVYCACGWKCNIRTDRSNSYKGYDSLAGHYICQRYPTDPERRPPDCVNNTGSKKVDTYVWNFVKKICSNPALVKAAIEVKIKELQQEHDDLDQEVTRLQKLLDQLTSERQWIITQARKGTITESDMEYQLGELQIQEWSYRHELDEYQALTVAKKQATALSAWADQYLTDIHVGIAALEVDIDKVTETQFETMFNELQAWRFADKFPSDRVSQLKWAVLEEKRRVVRTLIDRVIIGRGENGESRKITPILALDIPLDKLDSLDSGYQSLTYNPDELVVA